MKIKIIENNKNEIEGELNELQKKCSVRTRTVEDIFTTVTEIENKINKLKILKKNQNGLIVTRRFSEHFANCYKGNPMGTVYEIKKTNASWFLIKLYRYTARGNGNEYYVNYPEKAQQDIIFNCANF